MIDKDAKRFSKHHLNGRNTNLSHNAKADPKVKNPRVQTNESAISAQRNMQPDVIQEYNELIVGASCS